MVNRKRALIVAAAAAGISALASVQSSYGATQYWDNDGTAAGNDATTGAGLGGAGVWDTTSAKWWDGVSVADSTWVQGNDAQFKGAGGNVTMSGAITAGAITLNGTSPAGAVTFTGTGGNTLSFSSLTLPTTTNVTTTLAGGLAGTDINIVANNPAGVISPVQFGGTHSFTGNINLNGSVTTGTASSASRLAFNIQNAGSVPTTAAFNVSRNFSQIVFNTATAYGTLPNNININAGNATGNFETWIGGIAGATANLTGVISGNGVLTFASGASGGAVDVTLSNNNTYTGNTRFINAPAGVVRLGVNNALPTTGLVMGSGAAAIGSFDLNGKNQTIASLSSGGTGTQNGIVNNHLSDPSILTIRGITAGTYTGPLGSVVAGGTTASLPNTANHSNIRLVLDPLNTGTLSISTPAGVAYSGGTEVNGGTLLVGNTSGSGTGAATVTVGSGGKLGSTAGTAGIISGAVDNAGTIVPGGLAGIGNLTLTGGLTGQNGSNFNLEFNNVGNDKIAFASSSLTSPGGAQSINLNLIDLGAGLNNTGITPYTLFTYDAGAPLSTLDLTAAGPLKLVKPVAGIASMANFSLIHDGNAVKLNVSGVANRISWRGDANGSGPWDINTTANWDNSGATVYNNPDEVTFDQAVIPGTDPIVVSIDAGGVIPGNIIVSNTTRAITLQGGSIGGGGSITKTGTGTLTLTGNNTFTGGTTVAAGGILAIAGDASLGAAPSSPTVNLTLAKSAALVANLKFLNPTTLHANRSIVLTQSNGGGPQFDTNGNDVTINGQILGGTAAGVNLLKTGAGVLSLRGNNSTNAGGGFVNAIIVTGGLVNAAADNNLGQANGTLQMNGGGIQLGASFAMSNRNLSISGSGGGSVDTNGFNTSTGGNLIGGATNPFTKNGAGTLTITGTNTHTGGVTVAGGTLELKRLHAEAFTVNAGATLRVLESSPGVSSGHPAGDNAFVSRPTALTIDAAGFLDLTNNDLIIDYTGATPVATYEQLVRTAYNGTGDWQGPGITSSIAANDGNYVVAIADNATLAAPFGTAQGGPLFAGQDVDLDTVLIKFTHRADINLDGLITPDDSAIFGGNYDENQPAVWATGDMNYDGIYTPDDAAIFGGAYDEALASLPEPASLGALGLMGVLMTRRSRRSAV